MKWDWSWESNKMRLGCGGILIFGLIQFLIGMKGIYFTFGTWGGLATLILLFGFRFTLPLTIGTFLCAKNVFGWHWAFAVLLAMPSLIFIIPSMMSSAIATVKR